MSTPDPRYWLTVYETAYLLGESERRVREMARAGELPVHEPALGQAVRLSANGLEPRLPLRSALLMDELLAGLRTAPRARRPWQRPPAIH